MQPLAYVIIGDMIATFHFWSKAICGARTDLACVLKSGDNQWTKIDYVVVGVWNPTAIDRFGRKSGVIIDQTRPNTKLKTILDKARCVIWKSSTQ